MRTFKEYLPGFVDSSKSPIEINFDGYNYLFTNDFFKHYVDIDKGHSKFVIDGRYVLNDGFVIGFID